MNERPFLVTNASGEELAATEHFDEALTLLRLLPAAHEVVHEANGKLLAYRGRPLLMQQFRGVA